MKYYGRHIKWAVAMALAASACTTACTSTSDTSETEESAQTAASSTMNTTSTKITSTATTTEEAIIDKSRAASASPNVDSSQTRSSYDEDDFIGMHDTFDGEITLLGDAAKAEGDGISIDGSTVSITKGGTYRLSGSLTNGQIAVSGSDKVKLFLDGVSVTNENGAALVCTNEKRTILSLADGTENCFTDGGTYAVSDNDDTMAAVYAKDKLTINGGGSLTVNGTAADGIVCKDALKITGGVITVDALHNGVKGTESIAMCGGTLNITSGNDGLKSTVADDAEKGWIALDGGTVNITAGGDGIQAETTLQILDGIYNITTTGEISVSSSEEWGFGGGMHGDGAFDGRGGGFPFDGGAPTMNAQGTAIVDDAASVTEEESLSSKGLKSCGAMELIGGDICIQSTDHCIHSGGEMTISGGMCMLSSSMAKGISAHGNLTVSGEETEITVKECTEGMESKAALTIAGGKVRILNASDDGLNTGGIQSDDHTLTISGGTVYIQADGDGVDSNGDMHFSGGVVIISGPTSGGDGSIDGDGTMYLDGGTVLGLSSRGMMEYPAGCMVTSQVSASAGDMISVLDENGNLILAVQTEKDVSDVIFGNGSGETMAGYTLMVGGTFEGTLCADGWASEGSLSGGTACNWRMAETAAGGFGGGGMHGGGFGGGQRPGFGFGQGPV